MKIEAKELRIGNYISVRHIESIIPEAREWSTESCNIYHIKDIYNQSKEWEYKPIPLTEQWLIDFGFEIKWIISHNEEYFNMFQQGEDYFYSADQHHHTSEAIKYVHQLQNLYFALTSKELTLKQ